MSKYAVAILGIFLAVNFCGCEQKGPVQKTGERADEIVDNVKKGDNPLKKKGPLEKAGESLDNTVKDDNH